MKTRRMFDTGDSTGNPRVFIAPSVHVMAIFVSGGHFLAALTRSPPLYIGESTADNQTDGG